jgi:CBS domain-containing protein
VATADDFAELTAADVMLRRPKSLPGSATVAEVRAMLADHPSVQMVLLADDGVFRGAITVVPDDAPDDAGALDYADSQPETLAPTESAATAFEAAAKHPHRRIVVLGEENELVGLLCLDRTRTHFCGT